MHIHIGAIDFFITAAYVLIFSYLWRTISAHLSDTSFGQAMAYIF